MTETNDLHICAEDRLTFLASQGRDIFRAVLNGAAVYPLEVKQEVIRIGALVDRRGDHYL
jgi:hypothetical protein